MNPNFLTCQRNRSMSQAAKIHKTKHPNAKQRPLHMVKNHNSLYGALGNTATSCKKTKNSSTRHHNTAVQMIQVVPRNLIARNRCRRTKLQPTSGNRTPTPQNKRGWKIRSTTTKKKTVPEVLGHQAGRPIAPEGRPFSSPRLQDTLTLSSLLQHSKYVRVWADDIRAFRRELTQPV